MMPADRPWKARVEQPVARAETGLVVRRVGDAEPGRQVAEPRRRQAAGDARVAGKDEAGRRPRIDRRLLIGHDGLDLVVALVPRGHDVPAQPVVDGHVRARAPAVLREHAAVLIAQVEDPARGLDVVARHAEQKVGEVGAGLGTGKRERAVERRVRLQPDLLELVLAAELQRCERPTPSTRLSARCRVSPVWLTPVMVTPIVKVLNTRFSTPSNCGARTTMPGVPGAGDEALRRQRHAEAAVRPAHVVVVVGEAGVKIVHGVRGRTSWRLQTTTAAPGPSVNASKPGTFAPPCWPG